MTFDIYYPTSVKYDLCTFHVRSFRTTLAFISQQTLYVKCNVFQWIIQYRFFSTSHLLLTVNSSMNLLVYTCCSGRNIEPAAQVRILLWTCWSTPAAQVGTLLWTCCSGRNIVMYLLVCTCCSGRNVVMYLLVYICCSGRNIVMSLLLRLEYYHETAGLHLLLRLEHCYEPAGLHLLLRLEHC